MPTLDASPEFQDSPAFDPEPSIQIHSLPVAEPQGEPVRSPRGKRPSELPGAAVAPPVGRILSVAQAAAALGVSTRQIRRLIESGALRAHALSPRRYSIRSADLKYVAIRHVGRPRGKAKASEDSV